MNDDLPSVKTVVIRCPKCGTRTPGSYHDDSHCGGLIIEFNGTLQCTKCSAQFTPSATCPTCGATATTCTTQSFVSLGQQISPAEIAGELRIELQQSSSNTLKDNTTLSGIASQYVSTFVEQSYFKSLSPNSKLLDWVDTQFLPIGGYQTFSFETFPNGETATAIASEVYNEFLTDFPDRNSEFTDIGIGVRWNPHGGLHVGVIAANRLASVPDDINPTKLEQAIHHVTNDRRADHGYGRLSNDMHLCGIARSHSREMATQGFFSHESPDGATTIERYQQANYNCHQAGENIAKRYVATTTDRETIATGVVDDWMDSPGHRENILTGSYDVEGIGVYQGGDSALFITQNFA